MTEPKILLIAGEENLEVADMLLPTFLNLFNLEVELMDSYELCEDIETITPESICIFIGEDENLGRLNSWAESIGANCHICQADKNEILELAAYLAVENNQMLNVDEEMLTSAYYCYLSLLFKDISTAYAFMMDEIADFFDADRVDVVTSDDTFGSGSRAGRWINGKLSKACHVYHYTNANLEELTEEDGTVSCMFFVDAKDENLVDILNKIEEMSKIENYKILCLTDVPEVFFPDSVSVIPLASSPYDYLSPLGFDEAAYLLLEVG